MVGRKNLLIQIKLNDYYHHAFFCNFQLRERHAKGEMWAGVDVNAEDVVDNLAACVWEPAVVKVNALTAATEAACLILSVDETIKAPQSNTDPTAGRPF